VVIPSAEYAFVGLGWCVSSLSEDEFRAGRGADWESDGPSGFNGRVARPQRRRGNGNSEDQRKRAGEFLDWPDALPNCLGYVPECFLREVCSIPVRLLRAAARGAFEQGAAQ
jgi:hypothetical protein